MKERKDGFLRLIAVFKLMKAVSLIAVGIGALHLLKSGDAADSLMHLVETFGFNPGGRYVDELLGKIANLPAKDFKDIGIGSFVYAALFLTEGIGLLLAKPWAEWFTTMITASLLPLEVYEMVHHPTPVKAVVMVLNVAIVVYLVVRIRTERRDRGLGLR